MSYTEKLIEALKNAPDEYGVIKISTQIRDIIVEELEKDLKWISVKERLPEEHPSMFYKLYGTEKWAKAMWRTESDRVLVTIKFPDGTRTVDKGKLQDGAWRTGVSPVLPQEVTHWALWPEPPKEDANETD